MLKLKERGMRLKKTRLEEKEKNRLYIINPTIIKFLSSLNMPLGYKMN
jgi:hypothetical protein